MDSAGKEKYKSEILNTSITDTLKFTSGIRAIFQDSRGDYWIGSLQEGVEVYDGKSFNYFTVSDGLSDNQIHSIQEDKEGVIWLGTQTGVSSYDGTRIRNHTQAGREIYQNVFQILGSDAKPDERLKSDHDLWFDAGKYVTQNYLWPPHQRIRVTSPFNRWTFLLEPVSRIT